MALAKVATPHPFSSQSFFSTMQFAWNMAQGVTFRAVEDNLFVVPVFCLGDWQKLMEEGPCLSPSVADHPLGPATDHRLGKLLPHQLANQTRAPPWADFSFCSSAYGVLATVSSCCSPPKGRFLRVTHPFATGNTTSRSTCMC